MKLSVVWTSVEFEMQNLYLYGRLCGTKALLVLLCYRYGISVGDVPDHWFMIDNSEIVVDNFFSHFLY